MAENYNAKIFFEEIATALLGVLFILPCGVLGSLASGRRKSLVGGRPLNVH